MTSLRYTPNKNSVGVLIHDIDLAKPISASVILTLQSLLRKYKLIIFEHQVLNDEGLCNFAYHFGPPFVSTKNNPVLGGSENLPSTILIGNKADRYGQSFLGYQEVLPHSDHQWLRCPSAASLLYAIDVDIGASTTTWTDMATAYTLLDNTTQARISGLQLITYNPFHRPFGSVRAKYIDRSIEQPPGAIYPHPLVRTHPISGEHILYLHAAYEMELLGVDYDDGRALIHALHKHIEQVNCKYEHSWKNGDLILWDNQATIHYRPAFASTVRRVLKRVSIAGSIPF